jgi:hypothetical protein
MGLEELTPRKTILLFVGFAIAILFIKGAVSLWSADYRRGILFLALGTGLTYAFFRKGKIAVVFIGLIFILVNVGLTAIFHPTVLGFFLTAGSAAALVVLGRWYAGKRRTPQG